MSRPDVQSASISEIQGTGYYSPLARQGVLTKGVVIAHSRRGFFLQDPAGRRGAEASCGIFVLSRKHRPPLGSLCEVEGLVLDYLANEFDRPVTEIKAASARVLQRNGPAIEPVWFSAATLPQDPVELALYLNAHEGMLAGIEAGAVFIAPSNPYADYVVAPADLGTDVLRSPEGGVLIDPEVPDRWYPSFRIIDYERSFPVNVGAVLQQPVTGGLNYRSQSWQIAVNHSVEVRAAAPASKTRTSLAPAANAFSVMTLNALNLDVKLESKAKVMDPARDVDDDVGEGRFIRLAEAIVQQADGPDIVALQEIQDNDGAELSEVVNAGATYRELIKQIKKLGGPAYRWADIPPQLGEDGGQPGGNIRNGYLYNPLRVQPVRDSLRLIAPGHAAFEDSRKPLTATFQLRDNHHAQLTLINVHLASKRHQRGLFAPELPGHDPKLQVRIEQAQLIQGVLAKLNELGRDYYVTGDFNDSEFSAPLKKLLGQESVNLVDSLAPEQRYDYNHRGKLQVLMHGIVSRRQQEQGRAEYEILHGNELIGVQPGDAGGKASDHAYTMARLTAGVTP